MHRLAWIGTLPHLRASCPDAGIESGAQETRKGVPHIQFFFPGGKFYNLPQLSCVSQILSPHHTSKSDTLEKVSLEPTYESFSKGLS